MRVLLTGSVGRIGRCLVGPFADRYQLRTFDREADPRSPDHIQADLGDRAALDRACAGCEVLVHLAAHPNEADFLETLVPANVVGCYNAFEAARAAGIRRIVFASTCQTMIGRRDGPIRVTDQPTPSTLYGATKLLGEAMGRWYHDQHGLEFVGLRIGAFMADDESPERQARAATSRTWRGLWFAESDAVDFFQRAVETADIGYAVVFGTSGTDWEWLDIDETERVLGYRPQQHVAERFGPFPEPV